MENYIPNAEVVGIGGVAIALIWVLYRIVVNHINHNSEVLSELKEAIHKLADILERKL